MQREALEKFQEILRQSGNHVTDTRVLIFRLLLNQKPQTMNQLIARAKDKADRVSVYRNIELFEKMGIVNRIQIGWKYKLELSDQFVAHHHHLNCLRCSTVTDIEDAAIGEIIDKISRAHDFEPTRHTFEVDGYCATCSRLS
jgi:Fe2+ or Zn2+ uptake regulation protein